MSRADDRSEAIVFGGGQPHIGAIILPTDIAKDLTPAQLVPLIWPTVELANKDAPSHSQLLPEMLIYLQHDTQIPRADKGSIIRPRVYAQFEREINEVRTCLFMVTDASFMRDTRLEKQSYRVGRPPRKPCKGPNCRTLSLAQLPRSSGQNQSRLMKRRTCLTLGEHLARAKLNTSIDSLQASRIRNILQQNLELNGRRMAGNMVFEHPTVEQ